MLSERSPLTPSETTAPTELLTPRQVYERLNISPSTLSGWARTGVMECIKLPGGQRRYRAADVERILAGATP